MTPVLEVVRAGAGSGKTFDLCNTVATAVADGLDPSRILATTFTKRASAELKGRIQARLLESGNGSPAKAHAFADRLELAAIGTVHGVAHQLLSRYAIELGLSPRLDVVTVVARSRAIKELLGSVSIEAWDALTTVASRLAVTDLHTSILKLLAAKRGNRIDDNTFRACMNASADRVCELLASGLPPSTGSPITHLYDLATDAMSKLDALSNDVTQVTDKARQTLRRLCAQKSSVWNVYLLAGKIEAGKRSGADACLHPLRTHASQVGQNPKLHADIRDFSARLAEQTIRLAADYQTYKTERGFVDFTDLEILLLDLLESPILAASVSEDFDIILVDEFQDTNPLQLAIFQRLRDLAPRSRWVGDPKQAIYGFRDTDPELVNNVWTNAPGAQRTELSDNFRSQRGLVQIVGRLFEPVFGSEAVQNPTNLPTPRGVERWLLETKNQDDDSIALACGIAQLQAEGIRFGDIAILERTNDLLKKAASALEGIGIPYLLGSPGLLSTREGVLVLAGLRLVADRRDSLAAATILHVLSDFGNDTPAWLVERLLALKTAAEDAAFEESCDDAFSLPWEDDARFSALEAIDRHTLSPVLVIQQVIEALDLPTLVKSWTDPARRAANLDSLIEHAIDFEDSAQEAGHAATTTGLILFFEQLAKSEEDVRHPPLGHNAVTLTTYHSAKGLEWPVVVLSSLDSVRAPDLWSPLVTGGVPGVASPLEGRVLQAWMWPYGYVDGPYSSRFPDKNLENAARSSPEGVERSDYAMQESIRLLYVGCTRAKNKLVFVHRPGKYDWLKFIPPIDSLLDCTRGEGEFAIDAVDTTLVVRHLRPDMADGCTLPASTTERGLLVPSPVRVSHLPRFQRPSEATAPKTSVTLRLRKLSGPSFFPSGATEEEYSAIGDAVHAYFAALPSMRNLDRKQKEAVAERCLAAFSVTGQLTPIALVSSGGRFCVWVEAQYPGARWHTEVPLTVPAEKGGQWNGTIDLLLEMPDGRLVIIDHKSAPLRREHCEAKAATFTGQLTAYNAMVGTLDQSVQAVWIHFPLAGVVAELTIN